MSGYAARNDDLVQRHGVAHAQGRAAGNLIVARRERAQCVVEMRSLYARKVAKGTEVESEQRNAGETVYCGEHRAVSAEHHDGFRLFVDAAHGQPERGGQCRKALAHSISPRFVPVHMKHYLSHGE